MCKGCGVNSIGCGPMTSVLYPPSLSSRQIYLDLDGCFGIPTLNSSLFILIFPYNGLLVFLNSSHFLNILSLSIFWISPICLKLVAVLLRQGGLVFLLGFILNLFCWIESYHIYSYSYGQQPPHRRLDHYRETSVNLEKLLICRGSTHIVVLGQSTAIISTFVPI